MGAWDVGPFSNDDALDWLYELMEAGDDGPLEEALGAVIAASADDYLDADVCCAALAAAEVVAALAGHGMADAPDDLVEWVGLQTPKVAAALVAAYRDNAIAAVRRIGSDSELAELWAESDDDAAWRAGLDDVVWRLGKTSA